MNNKELELAQLLAARLNHDYVAPLTAISNSCELMQLSNMASNDYIKLITDSVESAINLVQFYRIAFGSFSSEQRLTLLDAVQRMEVVASEANIEARFSSFDESILKSDAKLLFLAFLSLRSCYARMKRIDFQKTETGYVIETQGEGLLNLDGEYRYEGVWGETEKPDSTNIQIAILVQSLRELGYDFSRNFGEDEIRLGLQSST